MLHGPRPSGVRFGRPRAIVCGLFVAAALFVALFPWFPGGERLEEGERSPATLVAPHAISFDSHVRTEQVRGEAAAAVREVVVLDPAIRERQLAELDRQIDGIARARSDSSLSASARESAIRGVAGTLLSPRSAQSLAGASPVDWDATASEARSALGRTLSVSTRESELDAARQRSAGFVSASLSGELRTAASELIAPLVVPTLVVDAARTAAQRAEARANQPPVHVNRARGEVLVSDGQRLSAADVELLERAGLHRDGVRLGDVAASALLALLLGGGVSGYLLVAQPASLRGLRRLLLFGLLLLLPALAVKLALPLALPDRDRHFLAYALPIAAAPMAAAVLLEVGVAVVLTLLLASVASFMTVFVPLTQAGGAGELETARMWLTVTAASLAGMAVAVRADRLNRYLAAGMAAGVAAGVSLLVVWLVDVDRRAVDIVWIAAVAAASGVLSALIAVGVFVLFSRPFGIITRVELMELTQLSHPLLRRLQDEAPGTFQHSIVVGNLAERAAARIGADALLVRIGSYYHDIGKLVAPPFFIENSGEESPHRPLDPLQSTRVILQHVTQGMEIGRRERLPEAVVQFIPQHHGTRLVSFFYRRAAAADPEIDPELFRYPGPKPQSRETALVMLADSCEATVRASADRSAERIREIVEGVIRERLEEGQFDECDISLRDLRVVAEAYASTLNAVYHPRVQYPEPTERELAGRRVARLPERDEGVRWPRLRPRPAPPQLPITRASDAELSEDSP